MCIETTNYCNLDCPMCLPKSTRDQGFMDLALLKKIVYENRAILGKQKVWLHFNGEPLLHPKLGFIIKFLNENGVITRLSTNCTYLNEKTSEMLLESGLYEIVFSIDGATKETYEGIRLGAGFDEVEKNVSAFLEMKKEKGCKTPITQVQIIRMPRTESEIPMFVQKWKTTSVDWIQVRALSTRAQQIKMKSSEDSGSRNQRNRRSRSPCFWLWDSLIILWNGKVVPCCCDLGGTMIVGDLTKNTIMEVWNGEAMQRLRKEQINGEYRGLCKQCLEWEGLGALLRGHNNSIRALIKFFTQKNGRKIHTFIRND